MSHFLCKLLTGHDGSFCHGVIYHHKSLWLIRLVGLGHVVGSYIWHEARRM